MGRCNCISSCIPDQPQSLPGDSSASIHQSIKRCHKAAKQTIDLCNSTLATGDELVSCGNEIEQSLMIAAADISAESFGVIADLLNGDKTKKACELANTIKGKSAECIALSMEMVAMLEKSVDALPDAMESYVEKQAQQSITKELTPLERDMVGEIDKEEKELISCIDAMDNLKLLTAVEAGTRSFQSIKSKSQLCQHIFEVIKRFAIDITSVTQSIHNTDTSTVISKVKDGSILKAIGLSRYIKQFAEGCKRIMSKIIELFRGTTGKLSTLWGALSHARDTMVSILADVVHARTLCGESGKKADRFKSTMASLGNTETLKLIESGCSIDKSMGDAVGSAREIDAEMEEAASKMKRAATMVGDEYQTLPSIITDGIREDADHDEVVNSIHAKIRDIQSDIQELETATKSIEESDALQAFMHGEMPNIPQKVDTCKDMIDTCTELADQSKSSIDAFLGKWTLDTAVPHIQSMRRIVSISKLMEGMVHQIHKLIKAMMTLLRVIAAKVPRAGDQAKSSALDSVVGAAGDYVSDGLNNMMGKMFRK